MSTIGFHLQAPVNNWTDAISVLPPNTPFLSVDDYFLCRDAKVANNNVFTIFRKWQQDQSFSSDYEIAKQRARNYFDRFIDGTWMQQGIYNYVDAVKEYNEYCATTQSEAERQLIITWLQAVNHVWNTEYRGTAKLGGRNIPLICLSCPIGNDIDPRFAEIIAANDNIISYHNYTHFIAGNRDVDDWRYHSGRWSYLDAQFTAMGIRAKWLGTESGPYLGVYDGWKHQDVLDGSLQRYITDCVQYQIDHTTSWNNANNNRWLGSVLFTSGGGDGWPMYELNGNEMLQIAEVVRDYRPVQPPIEPPIEPPPNNEFDQHIWDESVRRQLERDAAIQLNPGGALQLYITADGGTGKQHVTEEFTFGGHVAIATEEASTGLRNLYYTPIDDYNNIIRLYGEGSTLYGRG